MLGAGVSAADMSTSYMSTVGVSTARVSTADESSADMPTAAVSTAAELIVIIESVCQALDATLYISKAFDSVWHDGLLEYSKIKVERK